MNRILYFLLFAFPILAISQNINAGSIIGLNTSQVSGDNLSGFNKFGIRCGGFVNRKFNDFHIQIELQYINKGSRETIKKDMYNEGYRFQVNYIEMPLLINKMIYRNTSIETGLIIGYLLKWSETYDNLDSSGIDVQKTEYSFLIGCTQKIANKLYLNSRFSSSIIPIRDHFSRQTIGLNKGQYNTSISFALYYYFGSIIKK
tara:strand:- start:422 stop:1027 length:606 start_codon:yes stop_codon:yes gene_type:complete